MPKVPAPHQQPDMHLVVVQISVTNLSKSFAKQWVSIAVPIPDNHVGLDVSFHIDLLVHIRREVRPSLEKGHLIVVEIWKLAGNSLLAEGRLSKKWHRFAEGVHQTCAQ